jgi:hypothetical protein
LRVMKEDDIAEIQEPYVNVIPAKAGIQNCLII